MALSPGRPAVRASGTSARRAPASSAARAGAWRAIDDGRRDAIVHRLEDTLGATVRRGSSPRLDVLDLLATAFDNRGGVEALLSAVRFVAGQSLAVDRAEEALRPYRNR